MKVRASNKAASTAVEYFLYAIVIVETALAVFAYKAVSPNGQLGSIAMVYLGLIYLGVLGWVFYQLNRLYKRRKTAVQGPATSVAPAQSDTLAAVAGLPPAQSPATEPGQGALELGNESAGATPVPGSLLFGMTRIQLAIVLLVFLAALKGFSWAIANLVKP